MFDDSRSAESLERLGRVISDRFVFVPTPYVKPDGVVRIYGAVVGDDAIGRIKYFDVDAAEPRRVLKESTGFALDIGVAGAFDDNGVTPMCIVSRDDRLLLYYTGWQLSQRVRYLLFTGLAESFDGGETFVRVQRTPVLERNNSELICRTAAFVMYEEDRYRAWYIGGSETIMVGDKQLPTYSLHFAESTDGIHWGEGREIMTPNRPQEFGFGRPWVRRRGDGYEMWYSIRHVDLGYRIAYATSADGIAWERRDYLGLDTGQDWENEMTAFGAVFDAPSGTYLLYNGNGYGRTGVGLAQIVRK